MSQGILQLVLVIRVGNVVLDGSKDEDMNVRLAKEM